MVAPTLVGECAAKILEATISKIDSTAAGMREFTDINSGRLTLEGHMLRQSDVKDLQDLCYLRADAHSFPEQSTTIPNYEASRYGRYHFDTEEDAKALPNRPLAIMHVGIWEWWWHGTDYSWFNRRATGLMLRALDDTGSEVCERIGTVTMEVVYHNVTLGGLFEAKGEECVQKWERRTITIV